MTTHQHTSGAELLPWNRVVTPHIDIVQGQLSMDTYAANLGKVVQGDSSVRPVYCDAHAFFEATYLTAELRHILTDVLAVLAGRAVIGCCNCAPLLVAVKPIPCSLSITWRARVTYSGIYQG